MKQIEVGKDESRFKLSVSRFALPDLFYHGNAIKFVCIECIIGCKNGKKKEVHLTHSNWKYKIRIFPFLYLILAIEFAIFIMFSAPVPNPMHIEFHAERFSNGFSWKKEKKK